MDTNFSASFGALAGAWSTRSFSFNLPEATEAAADPVAEAFANSTDPSDTRAIIDSIVLSTQARAWSSAFSSISSFSESLGGDFGISFWGSFASSFGGGSGGSGLPDTLSFLRPSGLFSPTDSNSDGRLSVGELLDLAA
ncbi:MAG: hypothetical protein K2X32_09765 [Phycisphaerales bacterium]|nr:hypothetical protein [Phycisphaerales bacterium]